MIYRKSICLLLVFYPYRTSFLIFLFVLLPLRTCVNTYHYTQFNSGNIYDLYDTTRNKSFVHFLTINNVHISDGFTCQRLGLFVVDFWSDYLRNLVRGQITNCIGLYRTRYCQGFDSLPVEIANMKSANRKYNKKEIFNRRKWCGTTRMKRI